MTVVTLIPKVPLPESLNHLRPSSCCNYIYKVISKMMVLRMKGFMGELISQNQSAFIGGRMIQDNLIVAHEAFHALKQKTRGGRENLAIRLAVSKAYDNVEWNFLKRVLLAFGFSRWWVTRIMTLVTTVMYRYKVNGFMSSKLIRQRGGWCSFPID